MTLRVEQKFCIHSNKLQEFYIWLNSNQGKILYPKRKITSIYFDNLSFTSYTDAIEGTVPRKKIRLRFYNDNYKKTNLAYKNLENSANMGAAINLEVHAGHGLTYKSVSKISKINNISEFNIGHFLISDSLFVGLKKSIRKFKKILNN